MKIEKKNSFYVAVLVNPNQNILEEIRVLPFDYYQLYDCDSNKIKLIKEKYKKKIITAITISDTEDINKYKQFTDTTDIYLFDSKGYENSMSFDHALIEKLNLNKK